jgi:hypothetical protein
MVRPGGAAVTEARAALRAFDAIGDIEQWITEQRWKAGPDGWRVPERLQGWHCRGAGRGRSGQLHYERDTQQKLS